MALTSYFWWINGLNLMDALLTIVLIRRGLATEANPFVSTIGWQGKFALVMAASLVVDRLRPRALIVPIAALSAVLLYSVIGLFAQV